MPRSLSNLPTEQEMARAYFAQLDPSTVSADESAEAFLMAHPRTPPAHHDWCPVPCPWTYAELTQDVAEDA